MRLTLKHPRQEPLNKLKAGTINRVRILPSGMVALCYTKGAAGYWVYENITWNIWKSYGPVGKDRNEALRHFDSICMWPHLNQKESL